MEPKGAKTNINSEGCKMVLHKNSENQSLYNGSWGSSQFNNVAFH